MRLRHHLGFIDEYPRADELIVLNIGFDVDENFLACPQSIRALERRMGAEFGALG
jgi:hypothetical protein